MENEQAPERLMHPHEVATLAGVDPKTVTMWARSGKLPHTTTLGGHRRYKESVVREVLGLDPLEVQEE